VISGTEVTVRRISALIAEQVRFGVLGVSEETLWDRESRKRLPKYVWITPVGWKMLGVDLMKLQEQQLKKLRECEERQALIKEGLLGEHEEISVRARKRWYEQRSVKPCIIAVQKAPHVSVQTVWPECPGTVRSMK
jgi:hypothetical protein